MILTLALRHLRVKRLRSLLLLSGFALGVGVMIVLLSIGEAMLAQSRDVALVGGGEVTVLPQGIDIDALRTGGVGSMFFGIERARLLTRQSLGGPRHAGVVRAVAPAIEGKLLYLSHGGVTVPVRAGGEIPSRARAVGAGIDVRHGAWRDSRADSAYIAPTAEQLYHELDRFHVPARRDSSWAEWHYFNVVVGPDEWWYITFRVARPRGRWGGQVLISRRRPDGVYERFDTEVAPSGIVLDTTRADLVLGASEVRQRDGVYHLRAVGRAADGVRIDLTVRPAPNRYFPPIELRSDDLVSGYVVPALAATASGRLCARGRCRTVTAAPAYHDHNWGGWRDVTWEWGSAQGTALTLLYGGVRGPAAVPGAVPLLLVVADSFGVRQVLRFRAIDYVGAQLAKGAPRVAAPERFRLVAALDADTLHLTVRVREALATEVPSATFNRHFLQMRGDFTLAGRLSGSAAADSGSGFFETWR